MRRQYYLNIQNEGRELKADSRILFELGKADKEELDSESVESGDEGPVERLDSLEEGLSLLEPLVLHEDATKKTR